MAKAKENKKLQKIIEDVDDYWKEKGKNHALLLKNIKANMKELEELYKEASGHWEYEDPVYRYYHNSFKVYRVQDLTVKIFNLLKKMSPRKDNELNKDLMEIFIQGTGKEFKMEDNKNWSVVCRSILEAFFHTRFFLEMAIKYGKELEEAPNCLPSGWASLLYLYNLR